MSKTVSRRLFEKNTQFTFISKNEANENVIYCQADLFHYLEHEIKMKCKLCKEEYQ